MWLKVNQDGIPKDLKSYNSWVVWRAELRGDTWTKVPYNPLSGEKARSNDSSTWTSFANALNALNTGEYDGIGFVLSKEDPFSGWDFDGCLDQDGNVDPQIKEFVDALDSYTEISPSGTGLRIIVKSQLPPGGRKKDKIEVYDSGRFLTLTGNVFGGSQKTIEARQKIVDELHAKIFAKKGAGQEKRELREMDREILEKAFKSKGGDNIKALFDGDIRGYDSHSEADMGLCTHLAFWFNKDPQRIDRVFRASGLMRPKWDERHFASGQTYGEHTIQEAIKNAREVYQEKKAKKKASMATLLVGLVPDNSLFHNDDEPYVDLEIDGHRETWPVRSKTFRNWLSRKGYEQLNKTPSTQAMQDALNVVEGKARFERPEREVCVRIAEHGGNIYLDLGRDDWSVVEVTPEGWQVVQAKNCEIRFWRPQGLKPLPIPEHGGNIEALRDLINIQSERDFRLIVGWLLSALCPQGPYPILTFSGEQGTGKSTTGRFLRKLIDPNVADLRTTTRTEHDLVIAARNGWVIALDNLSGIKTWLSDALCRLATGGGFGTRELYTDTDEVLIEVQRPIILNGIEDLCARGDLADRSIVVELTQIPKSKRRTEKALNERFKRAQPYILGSLLNGVVSGLRHRGNVTLEELPRMADAATWWCACEREGELPWGEGGILEAYWQSRENIVETFIETDEVANAVVKLIQNRGEFYGTMQGLLGALEEIRGEDKPSRYWPANARALSSRLKRSASFLRECGIDIVRPGRKDKGGHPLIHIKEEEVRNFSSECSENTKNTNFACTNKDLPSEHCSEYCLNISEHCKPMFRTLQTNVQKKNYSQNNRLSNISERSERSEANKLSSSCVDIPKPPPPLAPCPTCGSEKFWRLKNGDIWVCRVCHPPQEDEYIECELGKGEQPISPLRDGVQEEGVIV